MRKAKFPIIDDRTHELYLTLSKSVLKRFGHMTPRVLKTDAWNELKGALPIGGIVPKLWGNCRIVEYKKDVCEGAKEMFPSLDITQGDIRSLPFEDNSFDVILDLSTLDHIPPQDVPVALKEYNRVLDGGYFLLVTWFRDGDYPQEPNKEWSPDNQYLFEYDKVVPEIKKYFEVVEEETIYAEPKRYLHYMLMNKHGK